MSALPGVPPLPPAGGAPTSTAVAVAASVSNDGYYVRDAIIGDIAVLTQLTIEDARCTGNSNVPTNDPVTVRNVITAAIQTPTTLVRYLVLVSTLSQSTSNIFNTETSDELQVASSDSSSGDVLDVAAAPPSKKRKIEHGSEVVVGMTSIRKERSIWDNGFYCWIDSLYVQPFPQRDHAGLMSIMLRHVQALVDDDDQAIELRFHAHKRNQNVATALDSIGWIASPYTIMTKQPNHRNEAATATNPIDLVLTNDHIMESIFTYLPIKEQVRNKLVCHRWQDLNEKSIEISPKKVFKTNTELRIAVLAYCNQQGWTFGRDGFFDIQVPPPTRSQCEMVLKVYGNVINDWNVSEIEDFDNVFRDCQNFNDNISAWNTSKAKSMRYMFRRASLFNQPLNTWNTSNVESMVSMFGGALSFNQPLSAWNTSKVKSMDNMFGRASAFNQPLNGWNTSNVEDMSSMFFGASSFNQPLNTWNTSNVENMDHMFSGATAFNQPLNTWNTSNSKRMKEMFYGARSFNQPLNGWNTSNVENMHGTFSGATTFNQPLNGWNTEKVEIMSWMFHNALVFNQPLSRWNTSNVTSMWHMFDGASAFSHPIDMWDTSAIGSQNAMPLAGYD